MSVNENGMVGLMKDRYMELMKAERDLEAVKKHYVKRPKVVHAPLWFMKLGKILEAKE